MISFGRYGIAGSTPAQRAKNYGGIRSEGSDTCLENKVLAYAGRGSNPHSSARIYAAVFLIELMENNVSGLRARAGSDF